MSSEKKGSASGSTFEQDLEKLEALVNDLETGKLPLDEALRRFEAGVGLVRKCEKTLHEAERKIEMLVKGMDGELAAQPFDESAAESEADTPVNNLKAKPSQRSAPGKVSEPEEVPPPDYEEAEPPFEDADDMDELF